MVVCVSMWTGTCVLQSFFSDTFNWVSLMVVRNERERERERERKRDRGGELGRERVSMV